MPWFFYLLAINFLLWLSKDLLVWKGDGMAVEINKALSSPFFMSWTMSDGIRYILYVWYYILSLLNLFFAFVKMWYCSSLPANRFSNAPSCIASMLGWSWELITHIFRSSLVKYIFYHVDQTIPSRVIQYPLLPRHPIWLRIKEYSLIFVHLQSYRWLLIYG